MASPAVLEWTGLVTTIDANGDGKGVVGIDIADDIELKTWNNSFSDYDDTTLIEPGSPVFTSALALNEGELVTFSGSFVDGDEGECIKESSLSLTGKVQTPDFIFRFSELSAG